MFERFVYDNDGPTELDPCLEIETPSDKLGTIDAHPDDVELHIYGPEHEDENHIIYIDSEEHNIPYRIPLEDLDHDIAGLLIELGCNATYYADTDEARQYVLEQVLSTRAETNNSEVHTFSPEPYSSSNFSRKYIETVSSDIVRPWMLEQKKANVVAIGMLFYIAILAIISAKNK